MELSHIYLLSCNCKTLWQEAKVGLQKNNQPIFIWWIFFSAIARNSWTDLTLLNAGPGRVVVVERFCTMILPLITEKKQTVKIFFFNVIPSRFFHTKQVLLHHTWLYLILIFWFFLKQQDFLLIKVIFVFVTYILRSCDHGVMNLLGHRLYRRLKWFAFHHLTPSSLWQSRGENLDWSQQDGLG